MTLSFDPVRIRAGATAALQRSPGLQPLVDLVGCLDEIDRLKAALGPTAPAVTGSPELVCLECGNSAVDGFRGVTHHHAESADEYDTECKECGNLDIAESPRDAIATLTTRVDTERAAKERLIEDLTKILNPVERTYHWFHPDHAQLISYPQLSDRDMAGTVRMLYRTDLEHEPIVCGARDRIVHLAEIVEAAREVVKKAAKP